MKAGSFFLNDQGAVEGRIQALGLGNMDAVFEERTSNTGTTYYKIIADPHGTPFEIGSAWPREKNGLKYYSVSLETVFSPEPITAALFPDKLLKNVFNLIWNKDYNAKAKADVKTEAKPASENQTPASNSVAAAGGEPVSLPDKKASQRSKSKLMAALNP